MPDPLTLARRLLGRAEADEAVEVCAGRSVTTRIRVHGGGVESLTVAESFGIGVRVVCDGREGFAHAGSFADDVVAGLVDEARDNARFAQPDERVGLAEPDGVVAVALDPWSDAVADTPLDDKIAAAIEVERLVKRFDRRIRGVRTAMYGDSRGEHAVVSTSGIEAADRATSASLSVTALIDDVDGGSRTGSAVDAARHPGLLDPALVAEMAATRGLRLLGAEPPVTGRTTVVFEPRFAATLLGIVAGMLSGERVAKGRTPFAGRVGEAVATGRLSIADDPTDPASLGASPYDGEGIATRAVPLVVDGELAGYLHDARSARSLGVASTGSAVRSVRGTPSPGHRSLQVGAGEGDLGSLVAGVDDGLLVGSLQGLHSGVNPVSGDFSVGVEGVRIRDGDLAEPVREGTLAGAIPRLLHDISAVGADLERQPGGARVPSLVVEGLVLGGEGPDR